MQPLPKCSLSDLSLHIKGELWSKKRKNYHRCVTYRTVAGKNFRSQNLKEKIGGTVPPAFVFIYCTDVFTHIPKPLYSLPEPLYSFY